VVRGHVSVARVDVQQDVIAIARDAQAAVIQVFFVRGGKIIGRDHYALQGVDEEDDDAVVVTEFVKRFYDEASSVPPEIIVPVPLVEEEAGAVAEWLRERRQVLASEGVPVDGPGRQVILTAPQRGKKRQVLDMALSNARETLALLHAQWDSDPHRQEVAIAELQAALDLPNPPNRIECYDISTTQGTAITASRVVFVQGVPLKKEYRRFNIKNVQGQDDYASMREALTRRFRRYADALCQAEEAAPGQPPADETWRILPDLLIVDGGKGQLNVAVEVLGAFDLLGKVPVAGLAKQHEDLFVPGQTRPVRLPRRSPALYLVQRVRDEAHRFALALHRKRRAKLGVASQLEEVPGVGPARRKALLKAFGSIQAIREAEVDAIAAVPGITEELARTIKATL
jgi:excinuclease ABC subunit C